MTHSGVELHVYNQAVCPQKYYMLKNTIIKK